jgi:hypothetical protein
MIENQATQVRVSFAPTFMSKVFFFFGLAVAVSAAGAYVGLNYLTAYFITYPGTIYGLIIAELALILTAGWWSKARPLNYFLFCLFALITGLTLVPILAYLTMTSGGVDILIKTFVATALMFGACAVYGQTTSRNLQGLGGFLIMALLGMIIVGIIGIFVPWSNTFEMVYAGLGVIIFSGYIMYDIQRLKFYPEDMYIDAALQLYLDIFNLFLYILRLISALNRK